MVGRRARGRDTLHVLVGVGSIQSAMPRLETFGPGMGIYRYAELSAGEAEQLLLRPKIDFSSAYHVQFALELLLFPLVKVFIRRARYLCVCPAHHRECEGARR